MDIAEIDKVIGREVHKDVQNTDSRYGMQRKFLLDDLFEDGILDAIAIHEAGHEHYYLNAGAYGLEFIPPVILFRKYHSYPFKRQLARIKVGGYAKNKDDKDCLPETREGLRGWRGMFQ